MLMMMQKVYEKKLIQLIKSLDVVVVVARMKAISHVYNGSDIGSNTFNYDSNEEKGKKM